MKMGAKGYLTVFAPALVFSAITLAAAPLLGQVPSWLTAVPTRTAPPSQNSPEPAETPVATPTPSPAPSGGGEPGPAGETRSSSESGGEQTTADAEVPPVDDESAPKGEQVTNPGAVAFTDYRPFDLDEIEHEPVKTKWGNFVAALKGLGRYSLFNGKVKFRIGGKAQFDGTAGSGNTTYDENYLPIETDFAVRRFDLFAAGRIKKFNFNLEFEFGPDWGLSDAWIEGAEGGLEVWGTYLGKLRVGLMNEPFSFQRQTSSFNIGFMERSLPVQTIAPGSNIGAMVHDSGRKGRHSWAFGMFSFGQKSDSNASVSALSITGRTTWLPVYRNNGSDLVHVGISLSSRSPTGGDTRYRSRPEARFVDYLVDTGNIDTGHLTLWGAEFATIRGPLWVSAEYIASKVSAAQLENPTFRGSYVEVGWILTGEHRPYRTNSGTFDRMRPRQKYGGGNPFKRKNGGAWEVVGRISNVDLTDGLVEGGELTDFGAALSWYPNATTRIEFNFVHARPKDRGTANIVLVRLQYQPW